MPDLRDRRARLLFIVPGEDGQFGCRECRGLLYESSRKSNRFVSRYRAQIRHGDWDTSSIQTSAQNFQWRAAIEAEEAAIHRDLFSNSRRRVVRALWRLDPEFRRWFLAELERDDAT